MGQYEIDIPPENISTTEESGEMDISLPLRGYYLGFGPECDVRCQLPCIDFSSLFIDLPAFSPDAAGNELLVKIGQMHK